METTLEVSPGPERAGALLALVREHCRAEAVQDLDAVLATVGPQPHFEIHPLGLALTSVEAVTAFYTRMISMFDQLKPLGPSATFDADDGGKFIGAQGVVTRDAALFHNADGEEVHIESLAFFQYDDESGKLKGERIFLNTAAAEAFRRALGPDFADMPGVVRLSGAA